MPQERTIVTTRRHPAVLRGPALLWLAAVIGSALVTADARTAGPVIVAWAGCAALTGALAWKLISWRRTYLVLTDHRVMLVSGLLTRRVTMMPLAKVTNVSLERPPPGRLLGFGTLVIESAGRDHPLSRLTCIPRPEQIWAELSRLVMAG